MKQLFSNTGSSPNCYSITKLVTLSAEISYDKTGANRSVLKGHLPTFVTETIKSCSKKSIHIT